MKSLLKMFRAWRVLRQWSGPRSAIVIEPNPHSMRAVFERSPATSPEHELPLTPWHWPTSTWFQERLEQKRLRT